MNLYDIIKMNISKEEKPSLIYIAENRIRAIYFVPDDKTIYFCNLRTLNDFMKKQDMKTKFTIECLDKEWFTLYTYKGHYLEFDTSELEDICKPGFTAYYTGGRTETHYVVMYIVTIEKSEF